MYVPKVVSTTLYDRLCNRFSFMSFVFATHHDKRNSRFASNLLSLL